MTVCVLWLFLTVPRVGLQCVIVTFRDHTHLLFEICSVSFNRIINDQILYVYQFSKSPHNELPQKCKIFPMFNISEQLVRKCFEI